MTAFGVDCTLDFHTLTPAGRIGKGPTDSMSRVVLLMQGMSVPHLAQLKISLREQDIPMSVRGKRGHA